MKVSKLANSRDLGTDCKNGSKGKVSRWVPWLPDTRLVLVHKV